MKTYQSTKIVQAEPMMYHEAGKELIRDYDSYAEDQFGYRVVYADGYTSWSPKKVFEEGYVLLEEGEQDVR